MPDEPDVKKLLRRSGIFLEFLTGTFRQSFLCCVSHVHLARAAVPNFEAADPEQHIFGDVRGVVSDALEMARSQNKLKIRSG